MSKHQIKHPVIRYHGGKFRLAKWILSYFPEHRCYVEPFGGVASVLMQKERSYAEIYNDLDSEVVNLFKVLRDPELNIKLQEACLLTAYSRDEFMLAKEFIDIRQVWKGESFGSGGTVNLNEDIRGKTVYIKINGRGYMGVGIMPVKDELPIAINWWREFHLMGTRNNGKTAYCADSSYGINEIWVQD